MSQRTLTVRQAAQRLDRTPRTVLGWIRDGQLAATWTGDGYRIRLADLAGVVERVHTGPDGGLGSMSRTRMDTDNSHGGYTLDVAEDRSTPPKSPSIAEPTMPDMTDFLALAEAAKYIGRSTRTVRRWVQAGDLPRTRRVKTRLYVHPSDLEAMVQPANPDALAAATAVAS